MKKPLFVVVFITTSTEKEAQKISNNLLKEKLVSCVNIIKGVHSHFWWKDKIESANEFLLIAKTELNFFKNIVKIVKTLHSYEVPETIALPIIDGNKDYLDWIKKSIKKF
jgi:periplasmic divalent cation tolerance protein